MAIANALKRCLTDQGVDYSIVTHPRTQSSSRTAQAAHVPGARLAKPVVLHDEAGYLLAVLPATHRLELQALQTLLDRHLNLATEKEVGDLFGDCDIGAIPPIGAAYGVDVVLDESFADQPEVYFEAGDHRSLVRVDVGDFDRLMAGAQRGRFSHHI